MDKEWIELKEKERKENLVKWRKKILAFIDNADFLGEELQNRYKSKFGNLKNETEANFLSYDMKYLFHSTEDEETILLKSGMSVEQWRKSVDDLKIEDYVHNLFCDNLYDKYLDSEPKYFEGDIIITDPCYIIDELTDGDWEKCGYGFYMEALGISHYMTRDTLYGDWSCTTYNSDTAKVIGDFCADAGLVSVFLLDEVLKYNPHFDYHIRKPWTTTWIKNFKGTVQFVVKHKTGKYKYDFENCKAGDEWEDYSVCVIGKGVNKVTGEPLNFDTMQTGL